MPTVKPYATYKESGIAWAGLIPSHWIERPLVGGLKRIYTGGTPESGNERYWSNEMEGIPFVAIGDMSTVSHVRRTSRFVSQEGRSSKGLAMVPAGSVLYSMYASVGKAALLETPAVINQAILGLVEDEDTLDQKFLWRWLSVWERHIHTQTNASTQANINLQIVRKLQTLFPPLDEQRAIADFLDSMDARITRFIAARRKMIALLGEKKQAVINQAVTRGLDPSVPMQDSGVDWLGEIPAHWEVPQIGHFSSVGNGSTPSRSNYGYWATEGFPWLNSASVHAGLITSSNQFVTPLALAECHLPVVEPGDLLVAITGQGKTRGTAALVGLTATINQHMAYIKIRSPRVTQAFLHQVLVAAYRTLRELSSDSGSTKGALTCADIRHFRVPVPPVPEQRAIVDQINREASHVQSLISRHRREIELMQEYRTRLISDVVTGKLDVRGVELPAVEVVIGEEIEAAMEEGEPEDALEGELEYSGVEE